MGMRPGEKVQRLARIRVVDVRREPLLNMVGTYGAREAKLEGFLGMTGTQFVKMFCEHMGGDFLQEVTRIEFEYLENQKLLK